MKKLVVATALTMAMTLAQGALTGVALAGDPEAGRERAETCLGCHGVPRYVNTYPTYHVPKIAGQHEEYLVAALKAYRDKQRSHATMHANAGALSDEDIANIAAYLASLK
jgi:cytochrome c553